MTDPANAALQRAALARASECTRALHRANADYARAVQDRRDAVRDARALGCSYRVIARALGFKSVYAVQSILGEEKDVPNE